MAFSANTLRIPFLLLLLFLFSAAKGQQRVNIDSIRTARQYIIDSTRQERQRVMDSARASRQHITDSITALRKKFSDSLAAVRAYRSSKHFKDSVAKVRQQRVDSMRMAREHTFDSIRLARQHITDSLIAVRKHHSDSIRAVQKQRADSLAIIRKYRESKRYKDSVAFVRQQRLDSIRTERKHFNDSLIAARKRSIDSANAVRKHYNDSVAAVRKHFTDSLKTIRQARADSLAKIKEDRERLKKSQEKLNKDKMSLALELKIKKKHEAWSNEKMLKKKWSWPRRVVQNTFTRYNYYFNADKKMDEALENMQRIGKENYDSLIALFPFDPNRDSLKLAPDMDSIIRKASVGIQIHDPRTKWADDLYLLMGQAYYYKGNYNEAATAFRYIVAMNQQQKAKEQKNAARKKQKDKEVSIVDNDKNGALGFLKHRSVNNEAILWLARTYTQSNREDDAEAVLDLIETDKNLPDELKGRIALEKAFLNLGKENYKAAAPHLLIVAKDKEMPDWVRIRAAYLNGQIQFNEGNYEDAAKQFQTAIELHPKIEMDFYARKNLAYSLLQQGGDHQTATASLRKMLKDGKYLPYYEQIYYVLGRLSANNGDNDLAISNFQKSINSSRSTRKQKALSFAGLGDVYYSKGNYQGAKTAYDSATHYGRSSANEEPIAQAIKRAKALDRVVAPIETIHHQDSLLALSALSEKEQKQRVHQYLRALEKQLEDSIFKAGNDGAAPTVTSNSAGEGNWYFNSPVTLQQGFNDFKRKWGNRKNVDNWRRIGSTSAASTVSRTGDVDDGSTGEKSTQDAMPTEESLLAAIPNTETARQKANNKIEDALFDLAKAYVNDLEDFEKGMQTLDTLDHRFASHKHKAEALYLRYQIALKQNKLDKAQLFSQQLRQEFAGTQWAKRVVPEEDQQGLLASVPVADYYDETYGLMIQRDYREVLKRVRLAQEQYHDPIYGKRFRIMEAIALAGDGQFTEADSLLSAFIVANPADSLRSWADVVINYVRKNKPLEPAPDSGSVVKSPAAMPVTPVVTNNTSPNEITQPQVPPTYTYKTSAPHYFLFVFNKMESKAMGLKAGIKDFNTFNFGSQNLTSDLTMLRQDQGIITVKSFPSAAHAKIYMNAFRSNARLLKEYKPSEYTLMIISAENYAKLRADKDITPYSKFYKANYK